MLPAGQGGHGVAVHQGGNVAAHAVVPTAAVGVEFGGVGDGVAVGAQDGGHGVEGGEVEVGQAGHGPAEVDALHAASATGWRNTARAPACSRTAFMPSSS